ncbi:unnamed protein product, partial [Polarella glacialis]
ASRELAVQRGPALRLVSPPLVWDDARQVYASNFHGRVSRASCKNFQLAMADRTFQPVLGGLDGLCMQFGRIDDTSFSFDAAYPLSPVQ